MVIEVLKKVSVRPLCFFQHSKEENQQSINYSLLTIINNCNYLAGCITDKLVKLYISQNKDIENNIE